MQYEQFSSSLEDILPDSDDPLKEVYRIGDLANEFQVTLRTLRFYEDRGLIAPQRSGSTRLYSQKDRTRLKIILLAKRIGFSLVEIQEIMNVSDSDISKEEQLVIVMEKFKSQVGVLKVQRVELDDSLRELECVISSMREMIEDK